MLIQNTFDLLSGNFSPQDIRKREATHNFVANGERKSSRRIQATGGHKRSKHFLQHSVDRSSVKGTEQGGYMNRRQGLNKHSLLEVNRKYTGLHGHTSQGARPRNHGGVPSI